MKKSLWNIANGKEKKPRDPAQANAWEVRDNKAQAIIKLELDDTYIHHVDECNNAKDTWDVLNTLFESKSKSSKFGLLVEFFHLEMKPQTSLASHLNYMKTLLTQLSNIDLCIDEDISIGVLLKSLPSLEYNNVVTTVTYMPDPKLVEIEASLLKEEKKNKFKQESPRSSVREDVLYHNKGFSGKGKYKYNNTIICDFCHKVGHKEKDCFSRNKAQRAYLMCVTNNEEHGEEEQEHQEEVHQNLSMEVKKEGAFNTPLTSFDDRLF